MLILGRVVVRWVTRKDRDDMARLVRQADVLDEEIRIMHMPSLTSFFSGEIRSGLAKLQRRFAPSRLAHRGPK